MSDLSTLLADTDQRDASSALAMTEHGAAPAVPASDTVLAVDRWGRRRGSDLSAEWQELEAGEVEPTVAADAHASLFEPSPRFAERPKDASRAAWWRQLMETSEYQSLRSQTVLDATLSGLAAKSLCDQWIEYAAVQEPEPGDPMPGDDNEPIADQLARIRSTAKALAEARDTVNTAQDMAAGLGMGAGGSKLDQAALAEYFRRVRNDNNLRRILEFAGKAIRRCRALQRTKTTASRGELTGIELGGDVARLVPWELAQVSGAVPEVELLALYRLAQRRSLCYRHRKVEPKSSGPIVIVTDECLHPDTLIPLARGEIKRVADVQPGDVAVSVDWKTGRLISQTVGRIATVPVDGDLYSVRTPEGEIVCSGRHVFFVLRAGSVIELSAAQITAGDLLAAPRRLPSFDLVCRQEELAFSQLLGYLLGDGDKWHDRKRNSKRIAATDKDVGNLRLYSDIAVDCGLRRPLFRQRGGRNRLFFNNADLYDRLERDFPTLLIRSPRRSIPTAAIKWPLSRIARFIRGYFDAEGNIGDHSITLASSSKQIIDVLQLLLKRFGIVSERDMSASGFSDHDYHRVLIADRDSLHLFSERIGFGSASKINSLNTVLSRPRTDRGRVKRVAVNLACVRAIGRRVGLRLKQGHPLHWKQATPIVRNTSLRRLLAAIEDRIEALETADWTAFDRSLIRKAGLSETLLARRLRLTRNQVRKSFVRTSAGAAARRRAVMEVARNETMRAIAEVRPELDHLHAIASPDIYWTTVREVSTRATDTPVLHDLTMADGSPNYAAGNLLVHNSGSMAGEKIIAAKGIALALAWLARQQNRWVALVGFSGGTEGTRVVQSPTKADQASLIEWLEHFFNGGTAADVPFRELPFAFWPDFIAAGMQRGKTDIVVITDGEIVCDDDTADGFNAWKRSEQATVYGLCVDNEPTEVMERLCDRLWSLNQIELGSDAVESVLSI